MTTLKLDAGFLEKWLHQNKADYTGDFMPGVLLDNFMVSTKRGYAAIYETFLNEWSSIYTVQFEPGNAKNVWNEWEKRLAIDKENYPEFYGNL